MTVARMHHQLWYLRPITNRSYIGSVVRSTVDGIVSLLKLTSHVLHSSHKPNTTAYRLFALDCVFQQGAPPPYFSIWSEESLCLKQLLAISSVGQKLYEKSVRVTCVWVNKIHEKLKIRTAAANFGTLYGHVEVTWQARF